MAKRSLSQGPQKTKRVARAKLQQQLQQPQKRPVEDLAPKLLDSQFNVLAMIHLTQKSSPFVTQFNCESKGATLHLRRSETDDTTKEKNLTAAASVAEEKVAKRQLDIAVLDTQIKGIMERIEGGI